MNAVPRVPARSERSATSATITRADAVRASTDSCPIGCGSAGLWWSSPPSIGANLAIVRRVNNVERLEFPPGQVLYQTPGYISNIRFSPSGDRIAFADHPVYADDLGSPAIVSLQGQQILIGHARWMPDGQRVVFFGPTRSTPSRGYIQTLDGDSPKPFTPAGVQPSTWWAFAGSPDGRRVTARGADGVMALWPIDGRTPERLPQFPADGVAVQWSEDGRGLLIAQRIDAGWTVSRYDIASGRMQKVKDVVANEASGFRLTTLNVTHDARHIVHSYSRLLVDLILTQGLR